MQNIQSPSHTTWATTMPLLMKTVTFHRGWTQDMRAFTPPSSTGMISSICRPAEAMVRLRSSEGVHKDLE